MNRKDRRDGLSKSGSGRVGIYRETGLTHIYTLECNYNTGLTLNAIKAAKGKGERLASPPREGSVDPKRYTQDDFEQLGRAVCVAMRMVHWMKRVSWAPTVWRQPVTVCTSWTRVANGFGC